MDLEKLAQARACLFSGKPREAVDAYRQALGVQGDDLRELNPMVRKPSDGNEESAILEMGAAYHMLAQQVFLSGEPDGEEVFSLMEKGFSLNKRRSFVTGVQGQASLAFWMGSVLVQAGVAHLRRGVLFATRDFDENRFLADAVVFLSYCAMAAAIEPLPRHVLEYARENAFLLLHVHRDHRFPDAASFCAGRFGDPVYRRLRAEGVVLDGSGASDSKTMAYLLELVFYRPLPEAEAESTAQGVAS